MAYNRACNCWIINNHGKVVDIDNIAKIVGTAFPKAFQPISIKSGFQKTGIWPFNLQVFSKDSFLAAHMTDRDDPSRSEPATLSADPLKSHSLLFQFLSQLYFTYYNFLQ